MEAKDIIQLLRLQRHDLMNDLQIVHGYLSMGKTDKVKLKVEAIIDAFNQERTLMNVDCPNFVLWLIQVNLHHKHIHFTYDIHTDDTSLYDYDRVLTNIGNTLIDNILADKLEIITGEVKLMSSNHSIELVVTLNGQSIDGNEWKERLSRKLDDVLIQVKETGSDTRISFSIPS
ncbi:Spo0B domain-containing protein [Ornithinibacillus californiensis]|uniref:Spo0B domain-containing protein n=1 Tax=Ornithinibacillus californiensis TaxID=161536 RepID=UPI00064E101D|nr:Spo0B domain-containing protein [Ornithinibacillus californiensis]